MVSTSTPPSGRRLQSRHLAGWRRALGRARPRPRGGGARARTGRRVLQVYHDRGPFWRHGRAARRPGLRRLDGVVLDLGVSSLQLDDAGRGFSFAVDGPLDMRMSGAGLSAAEVVNSADADTLADILRRYGEDAARRLAQAIVKRRQGCRSPRASWPSWPPAWSVARPAASIRRPAPFRRCAFRSMTSSRSSSARQAAEELLVPGGRLVVVAFHSLEDRIVKRFLTERSGAAPAVAPSAAGGRTGGGGAGVCWPSVRSGRPGGDRGQSPGTFRAPALGGAGATPEPAP